MGEFDGWVHSEQIAPRLGEVVIGCGHTPHTPTVTTAPDPGNLSTWAELVAPQSFGVFHARWLVACAACLRAAGGDVRRVTYREHWTMTGLAATTHEHLQRLRELPCDDEHDHSRRVAAYLEELGETDPGSLFRVARAIGVKGL